MEDMLPTWEPKSSEGDMGTISVPIRAWSAPLRASQASSELVSVG